jgi:hypothetical protein
MHSRACRSRPARQPLRCGVARRGDAAQPPRANHDGGVILFGVDRKLYIIFGDAERRGQLQNLPSGPTETGLGPVVADDQFWRSWSRRRTYGDRLELLGGFRQRLLN